ncbi:MAG: hypothetical protein M1840_007917 [Geoglossum simile]|nr:MAG: hypothetical protein M1840_007917 [Geoglossum simile]
MSAASTLRIPYWDWAYNATVPEAVNAQAVRITTPRGLEVIKNPLVTYKFQGTPPQSGFRNDRTSTFLQTVRAPSEAGVSQPGIVNQDLQRNAATLHDQVYDSLTYIQAFSSFSNTGGVEDPPYASLEQSHNSVHVLVGGSGGGHMGRVDYAAFDPIFWLHHVNIDRLFAIWQVLNQDSYVTPQDSTGTFTTAPGSTEDVNTPLTPFHGPANVELTPANSLSTRRFGYTYPEVRDWGRSNEVIKSETITKVNALYNPSMKSSRRNLAMGSTPPLIIPPSLLVDGKYCKWFANIRVHKLRPILSLQFALGGPFSIHIFIGDVSDNPKDWGTDGSLVGTQAIFSDWNNTSREGEQYYVHTSIPLTRTLVKAHEKRLLKSLDPESSVPFLAKHLNWRISKHDSTAVYPDHVNTLKISASSQEAWVAASEHEFPTYGTSTTHTECTNGKPAGMKHGDNLQAR